MLHCVNRRLTKGLFRFGLVGNVSRCVSSFRHSGNSPHPSLDTIFALSSGNAMVKSGVSVIRMSGPASRSVVESLIRSDGDDGGTRFPKPRHASVKDLFCPMSGEKLDKALVIWMPKPSSFTGEDVCELHVHGSRAVINGVFEALRELDNPSKNQGIRHAEPGEFTRRAFDNGKMDLTEVEGLADLLEAETSLQRTQALRQMEGHLSKQFEIWRNILVKCLAHTEAVIDFGDDDREDDINDSALQSLIPIVRQLRNDIEYHLKDNKKGELVREGIRVALVGPPNAGKSSLLNLLARRPAAIVSPIAGTTRDIVEVRMELGGIPCIVSDTAGLRENSHDPIEKEGMKRAKDIFQYAQIKVYLSDYSDQSSLKISMNMLKSLLHNNENYSISQKNIVHKNSNENVLLVRNKCDLVVQSNTISNEDNAAELYPSFDISCITGEGISAFEQGLNNSITNLLEKSNTNSHNNIINSTLITRERHRRHLQICADHLDCFLNEHLLMDTSAEELRLAATELGKVIGKVDIEELLDVIFHDFCIGK
jgi:tRNA modification GTPase